MICDGCDRELAGLSEPCTLATLNIDGKTFHRIPFGDSNDLLGPRASAGDVCHDCGAPHGGVHHSHCDSERCPSCSGQLITCGCRPDFLPRFLTFTA